MKALIFPTFHLLLFMELATMALKEVEIFTIGEFGLVAQHSSHINQQWENSIVSSELKLYLSGKLFFKE